MPGIGEIQGTLSITLFDRDRNGEQKQFASRLQRLNDQMDDLARGIEQEIRKAVLDLESTEQQVAVTQQGLDLAQQELRLAEDRFRNGVTDNIEVVTAQDALSSAQDDRITALARHADATSSFDARSWCNGTELSDVPRRIHESTAEASLRAAGETAMKRIIADSDNCGRRGGSDGPILSRSGSASERRRTN